jgi:hypothetical protein
VAARETTSEPATKRGPMPTQTHAGFLVVAAARKRCNTAK